MKPIVYILELSNFPYYANLNNMCVSVRVGRKNKSHPAGRKYYFFLEIETVYIMAHKTTIYKKSDKVIYKSTLYNE